VKLAFDSESITDESTGTSIGLRDTTEAPTRTIADLVQHVGFLKNRTRVLVADSNDVHHSADELHAESLDQLLRTTTAQHAREPLAEMLEGLSDSGFSWREIARLAGVSVPAVRKWRQGESASGENRHRIARVTAFCEIVGEQYLIDDVASWLETPFHTEAPVTGLDLLTNDRFDLAMRLAGDDGVDPESILEQFEPDWRERYATSVEVFVAPDGQPGLRLREGDS